MACLPLPPNPFKPRCICGHRVHRFSIRPCKILARQLQIHKLGGTRVLRSTRLARSSASDLLYLQHCRHLSPNRANTTFPADLNRKIISFIGLARIEPARIALLAIGSCTRLVREASEDIPSPHHGQRACTDTEIEIEMGNGDSSSAISYRGL